MIATMAQPSVRRPPIDVRPQDARVLQLLFLAPDDAKTRLAIRVERARMIEGVGVEDQPRCTPSEAALDRTVEQPRPDATADIVGRQAEEDDLVLVELEIADQRAVVAGDVQLVARPGDQRSERLAREQPALVPQPQPPDAVVEIEVLRG